MDKIYDLVIIGCGPAGLTASIYAKRAGLDFLVLKDKSSPKISADCGRLANAV